MNRSKVGARLSEYLEGDLSERERSRFEAILAEDATLREELRELEATVALVRGLPEPEAPTALTTRVMARIEDGEADPAGPFAWIRRLFEPVVAVPLAAGIVALALVVGSEPGSMPALEAELAAARQVARAEARVASTPPSPLARTARGHPQMEQSLNEVQRLTLQTIMARHHGDLGSVLRSSGHPYAPVFASHFEGDGNLRTASFGLPVRRR